MPASSDAVTGYGAALAELLDGFLAEPAAPGVALGIAQPDRPPEVFCTGSAQLAPDRPVTPATRFRLASLTKQVIMAAVLRLVERGALALDEPVAPLLGSVTLRQRPGHRPITVADLLCNTSGVGDVLGWRQALAGDVRLPERLPARVFAHRPPGLRWEYSNVGFALLAQLVADRTGEPFQRHVTRTILQPLAAGAAVGARAAGRHGTGLHRRGGGPVGRRAVDARSAAAPTVA
jgi:CubicO group peptidase (beta-lactamase class C family)